MVLLRWLRLMKKSIDSFSLTVAVLSVKSETWLSKVVSNRRNDFIFQIFETRAKSFKSVGGGRRS